MISSSSTELAVESLLDFRHPISICDVRNESEFQKWKLNLASDTMAVDIPYFLTLEEGGVDDIIECVKVCHAKSGCSSGRHESFSMFYRNRYRTVRTT